MRIERNRIYLQIGESTIERIEKRIIFEIVSTIGIINIF